MALKLMPEDLSDVAPHLADRYESQAGRYWDLFYRRNSTKFFKDRHYLHKEFPDLVAGPATLLEVGCGVGNTVFPLYEYNPSLRIFCCDFAASAIDLVRQNPVYVAAGGAVQGFVADITSDLLAAPPGEGGCGVPEEGCDLATMVFVLSAIHPQRMAAAVHNVARCLRAGSGRLLFRDYAEGDLAQERLAGGDRPKRLGPNFYVRGDGTRCYYFGQEEVLALFASAGFACDSLALHERTVVNHKRDIAMDRRWLQAIFTLKHHVPPPLPLRTLLAQPPPLHNAHPTPHNSNGNGLESNRASSGGGMDVDSESAAGPSPAPLSAPFPSSAAPASASHPGAAAGAAAAAAPSNLGGGGCNGSPAAAEALSALAAPSGLAGGSWLTGAAGRLASHLAAGPGLPSGRALLPDSLDSADDLRAELSPSHHLHPSNHPHPHSANSSNSHAAGSGGHQQQQRPHRLSYGSDMQLDDDPATLQQIHALSQQQQQQQRPQHHSGSQDSHPHRHGVAAAAALAEEDRQLQQRQGGGGGGGGGGAATEAARAGGGGGGVGRSLEDQLEAEFFATIGRNSEEVVAEEVAAAGAALSRVRLVDVADVAAVRMAAAAAASTAAVGGGGGSPHAQQPQQALSEVEVAVAPGISFRCLAGLEPVTGSPAVPAAAVALARLLASSPRLLSGRCALQLGPAGPSPSSSPSFPSSFPSSSPLFSAPLSSSSAAPSSAPSSSTSTSGGVLPAMAAVRASCRRVVVTEAGREGLAAAAADLRRNAHMLVIERLRLATLDWAALGGGGGAASTAATGAAGYTYVTGPVRQLRDLLQMQPSGYDVVYAADPLAGVMGAAAVGAEAVAVAAARGLFDAATELLHPSGSCGGGSSSGGGGRQALSQPVAAVATPGRLLLVVVPGGWAAVHGLGFAALAAVCGWDLLEPGQLVEGWGVEAGAAAAGGCAVMGFRRRAAAA